MKRMKKVLSKLFDIVCFVVGPVLVVSNFLGYSQYSSYDRLQDAKIGIAIGVALICIGLLTKYWTKKG